MEYRCAIGELPAETGLTLIRHRQLPSETLFSGQRELLPELRLGQLEQVKACVSVQG